MVDRSTWRDTARPLGAIAETLASGPPAHEETVHDRTVLVTGAAGFIGLPVIRRLRAKGYGVVAVDDGSAGTLHRLNRIADDPQVVVRLLDIRHPDAVSHLVQDVRPWAVMHLAARHFIPDCEQRPARTLDINVLGTQHVLDACAQCPPQRFLFTSTADVYRPSESPHREDDPAGPSGVYGASKLLNEWLLRDQAWRLHGADVIVARIFNVYGPGDPHPHLVPEIIRQARAGDLLWLGDLATYRDYVFVDDVAEALVGLLLTGTPGIVNIGTGVATTGRELVQLASKLLDRQFDVRVEPARVRKRSRPVSTADPQRLRAMVPWWPRTSLPEGLKRTLHADVPAPQSHAGRWAS